MTWESAKREIERRALARHHRNAGTPLWLAVRDVLQASPALWAEYRRAIGAGERQEFQSSRPHDIICVTELEDHARAMVANSTTPMTLRDAVLTILRGS